HAFFYFPLYVFVLISPPSFIFTLFFFNDPATSEIYTLSLHDALPIYVLMTNCTSPFSIMDNTFGSSEPIFATSVIGIPVFPTKRSEEHTSELQSRFDLVCRLLLEKKKKYN